MSEPLAELPIPRVSLQGNAIERGRQYGQQAQDRIYRSITAYRRVFAQYAGWDWDEVVEHATRYKAAVVDFAPETIDEMRGIAEGASITFGDVLALNVRSEVMFASGADGNDDVGNAVANECSSFAVLPEATIDGHTLVGQNWDWLCHARDTVVLVDVRRDDGPDYVTVVEAGLLAKTGVNTAGVASCTNTLVSYAEDGDLGVPYHILLRKLLDSESITDAVSFVINAQKALSANYLIGQVDGLAIDLEVLPGGPRSVRTLMPEGDVLVHTNHFLSPEFVGSDFRLGHSPSTLFRLARVQSVLRREVPSISLESLQRSLSDHSNFPQGVCSHGDGRAPEHERYATVASVIYDLDAHEIHLCSGTPCSGNYRLYHFDATVGLVEVDRPEDDEKLAAHVLEAT